ncbi:MAG TPA: DMT family transporter [Streptosporangiaceae bacterium]|jgi:drug/metabolite transporter (DMT)-like permease
MLTVVLALLAAAGYSGSDYTAGLAAREADVVQVTFVAELVYCILLVAAVPFASSQSPSWSALVWGAVAGISGAVAAMALYLGFRYAAFSVVSSVSAVGSAAFSVLAGLLLGERPGAASLAGVALALPAIAAVSINNDQPHPANADSATGNPSTIGRRHATGQHTAGLVCGVVAGVGFGLFFLGLNQAGSGSDLWPLAAAALAGLAVVFFVAVAMSQVGLPPRGSRRLAISSGFTSAAGTYAFFLATHRGLLAITAVITSLYPAGTIMLARLFLRERLTVMRIAGLCLAAISIGLIAAANAH